MVSQKVCLVESLLSVRFITKFPSTEDIVVCLTDISCFNAQKTCIYNASWAVHRFVYTPLASLVNLSVKHLVDWKFDFWLV